VSLRKSPTRTPALLAANRANARKSARPAQPARQGPDSAEPGAAGAVYEAFRDKLVLVSECLDLYDWILGVIRPHSAAIAERGGGYLLSAA
jgi:hypothetical protein